LRAKRPDTYTHSDSYDNGYTDNDAYYNADPYRHNHTQCKPDSNTHWNANRNTYGNTNSDSNPEQHAENHSHNTNSDSILPAPHARTAALITAINEH